jgi:hypothetical protein
MRLATVADSRLTHRAPLLNRDHQGAIAPSGKLLRLVKLGARGQRPVILQQPEVFNNPAGRRLTRAERGPERRVHATLRAQGLRHSRKRVARLMRQAGRQGLAAKRWKKTTIADPGHGESRPDPARLHRRLLQAQHPLVRRRERPACPARVGWASWGQAVGSAASGGRSRSIIRDVPWLPPVLAV